MAFSYRELFLGKTKFCCCLPVRMGVIIMAVLGLLVSSLLSIVLWYQVSTGRKTMSAGMMAAFVIGGLVETFLFVASILGLVGAIVRKQSFVQIYAYITYIHFIVNLAVAIWLLVEISSARENASVTGCEQAIQNVDAQERCKEILTLGQTVYFVVATLVLVIELYGTLVVTRYVNQLKREKSYVRQSRQGVEEAFRLNAMKARYTALSTSHELDIMGPRGMYNDLENTEYDPYQEVAAVPPGMPISVPQLQRFMSFTDEGRPSPPIEAGYGGGTWTHEGITDEEKARLKRRERELGLDEDLEVAELPSESKGMDELPRYTHSGTVDNAKLK